MQPAAVPFNVSLLKLDDRALQGLRPVTSLEIFDNTKHNLADDGLFSTSIFGKVGDDRRNFRFSYIDIKIPVFHPVVLRALIKLKQLYGDIMAGQAYATWDDEKKDFERSNIAEGETGMAFFIRHWEDIVYPHTGSVERDQNIILVQKYAKQALTSKIIVMPAGMRDVEFDASERMTMDEINNFYKALLGISNTINPATIRTDVSLVDKARWRLQNTFRDLYNHIENMIQGKKKFLLGSWASRSPHHGTRNVITAMDVSNEELGGADSITSNHTMVGLYQFLKAYLPLCVYEIRNGFLPKIFGTVNTPAKLVNRKTLKPEMVTLPPSIFDRFMTDEGVEKLINAYEDEALRHRPVIVDNYYLGLVYIDKTPIITSKGIKTNGTFKFVQDIDELSDVQKKKCYPITFCEFMYLSCLNLFARNLPFFTTRYPVTGIGSIYPSFVYVRTTIKKLKLAELDDSWNVSGRIAFNYPVYDAAFLNSQVPHPVKVKGLGADYDGDMCSGLATYSDEAIAEVQNALKKRRAYVGANGKFIDSVAIDTTNLLYHNLTGD